MKDRMYLLDTMILVYAYDTACRFYEKAKEIRDKALNRDIKGCIAYQNLYEFFACLTDKNKTSNPITPIEAGAEIEKYIFSQIPVIMQTSGTCKKVIDIVRRYKIVKQEIYDVVLVATMLENGVNGIYTHNPEHFKKYPFLDVINPFMG